jgi:2-polyprenyl-6-methoxyphenol hydroxylase-like FAD-dependent oxidoreductase
VLFETLFNAVKATAGITLKLGVEIRSVERPGDTVELADASGARHGPFDLIVVCDGARSHLYDVKMPERSSHKYPWGALWYVARGVTGVPRRLYQVVHGTRRLLGLLPTGQAPGSSEPVASLFWSINLSQLDAFRAGDFDAWKREVLSYMSEAAPVLEQLRGPNDLLVSEYHDVVMRRWHGDRVVWLGDAAHATSPQLGQGCNLALIDSAVLADCLAENDLVTRAIWEYTRRRRSHLGYYQFATRWLTPFFQSDLTWLGPLRDAMFGFTTTLGPFRRQMLLGMAGIHRGLSSPMALPELGSGTVPARAEGEV